MNTNQLVSLELFIKRKCRRRFEDGQIAGLHIQEYWHPDILPPGSEQQITFYFADTTAFHSVSEFGAIVYLFLLEDDITEIDRSSFVLETSDPISSEAFENLWSNCVGKVATPPELNFNKSLTSFAISDDWNQKYYLAFDSEKYYAVCWSTSA